MINDRYLLADQTTDKPQSKIMSEAPGGFGDARIYLFGDGVYNLLGEIASILSGDRIYACREDMIARGVIAREEIAVPEDFYVAMTKDIMESNNQVYVF